MNLWTPTQLSEVVRSLLMAFDDWVRFICIFSCISKSLLDPVNYLKSCFLKQ